MSGKKSGLPDGRIPDRLPDGRPAVAWKSRWTEGVLPLWLVATAGGMAVIFVVFSSMLIVFVFCAFLFCKQKALSQTEPFVTFWSRKSG